MRWIERAPQFAKVFASFSKRSAVLLAKGQPLRRLVLCNNERLPSRLDRPGYQPAVGVGRWRQGLAVRPAGLRVQALKSARIFFATLLFPASGSGDHASISDHEDLCTDLASPNYLGGRKKVTIESGIKPDRPILELTDM